MSYGKVICGSSVDPDYGLASLASEKERTVVITDPVWPNAPAGLFAGINPFELFAAAALHFPRIARRAIVWLGCLSDPRFLSGVPQEMPFVRCCWLRYARPSYSGSRLNSGDVAYVFGSLEGPEGGTVLPGEKTATSSTGKETAHPCARKIEYAEWLVKNFTQRNDLVVDPFCGSGTTGVAALHQGRSFVGWEINPAFAAMSTVAISHAKEQMAFRWTESRKEQAAFRWTEGRRKTFDGPFG